MDTLSFLLKNVIVLLCCLHLAFSAPTGAIKERDTDAEDSDLTSKLQRLHDLLTELEKQESEKDLQNVADKNQSVVADEGNVQVARAVSSKDMRANIPEPQEKKQNDDSIGTAEDKRAIEVLSRALARLRQPRYDTETSVAGHLRAEKSRVRSLKEDKIDRLEETLRRALTRWSQDQADRSSEVDDDQNTYAETRNKILKKKFHEEALSLIEERLIRDVALGSRLGVSVDNLVDDLEEKAFKAAAMKTIEDGLTSSKDYGSYRR